MNRPARTRMHYMLAVFVLTLCAGARGAELQAKTVDGQTVQGDYLGTENDVVRIKTSYGVVSIPSKNIVSLTPVNSLEKPVAPVAVVATKKEVEPAPEVLVFHEPQTVALASLLAARMPRIPEPDVRSRLELFRCIRNFGDSSDFSRQRIVHTLAGYGLMAYPFIEGSYLGSNDLDDKVQLVGAVAGSHKPYSAQILATTHATVMSELSRTTVQAPQLPYEMTMRRPTSPTREQILRDIARDARIVEGYAAASGGPFNTLFLFNLYKLRYGGEADALLKNLTTDKARLAVVATDHSSSASGWTPADRVLLIESAFPLNFRDNEELKGLAQELLKKLLPDRHPKWEAPETEWVQWWSKERGEILRAK